ncbi:unnamed protein product [Pedinophyceae sp. YPF-701]|nr:unnamed protein product [Pedinophyceae sp. YPF-701]
MATEAAPSQPPEGLQYATFAGGCFWGVELAFQRVPGVVKTWAGYTQGHVESPSYQQVCRKDTGHTEAVLMTYDPQQVSFDTLFDTFLARTDVTALNRQGNDVGYQYRSGVYYHTPEQKEVAERRLAAEQEKLGKKVVAECLPAKTFYMAEDYHQQYLEKGGRGSCRRQSAAKGCADPIRCYG